jgi:hypothetical protein
MKKVLVMLAVAVIASSVYAGWVQETFTVTPNGTNSATGSCIVRGKLDSIRLAITTGKTGDVSFATSAGQTIFTKTGFSGDTTVYYPRYATVGSTASALTDSYSIWNNITNSVGTNPLYTPISIIDEVTATVVNTVTSGVWTIEINYED